MLVSCVYSYSRPIVCMAINDVAGEWVYHV